MNHGRRYWRAVSRFPGRLSFAGQSLTVSDLNTQPSEATYQLLVSSSSSLHARAVDDVNASRLVHTSLEHVSESFAETEEDTGGATGSNTPATTGKDDDEGEGELPDHDERSIANTRPCRAGDGILEVDELVGLMQQELGQGAISALGSVSSAAEGEDGETFGKRGGLDSMTGHGRDEPAYTCYTPLFKLTLGPSSSTCYFVPSCKPVS